MSDRRLPLLLTLTAIFHGLAVIWIVPIFQLQSEDRGLFLPAAAAFLCAPLVAVGLLRIKRVAWTLLYIEVAAIIAVAGATLYFTKDALFLLGGVAHAAATALVFLPRNMRAPFTGADRRGFREHKRFEINLRSVVEVDGARREAETMDLSKQGAYVGLHTGGLQMNQRIIVEVHLRNNRMLRLPAHIKSLNPEGLGTKPEGVGVRFSHLTEHDISAIDAFIDEGRRHMRTPVRVKASFDSRGDTQSCETYDLSASGCYLETDPALLSAGDQVGLTLYLHEGDRLDVVGEVSWLPDSEREGKPAGIAIEFRSLSKRDESRLRERLAESGIVGDD